MMNTPIRNFITLLTHLLFKAEGEEDKFTLSYEERPRKERDFEPFSVSRIKEILGKNPKHLEEVPLTEIAESLGVNYDTLLHPNLQIIKSNVPVSILMKGTEIFSVAIPRKELRKICKNAAPISFSEDYELLKKED